MTNKSKNEYAYSIFDVDGEINDKVKADLEEIEGVLRVRVIA